MPHREFDLRTRAGETPVLRHASTRGKPNPARRGKIEPLLRVLAEVFPAFTRAALDSLAKSGRIAEHPARVTLCREGEIEDRFFVVCEGKVDVHKLHGGELLLINQLERGGHFGDIGLLLDMPRSATLITAEPSRIFEVEHLAFARLLKNLKGAGTDLARMIIARFRSQEEKYLIELARLKGRHLPRLPKVFLSYARADVSFATRLTNNLIRQQINVWLDLYQLDPARSRARQIGEALDSSQLMLLVLSPAGVSSGSVEDEWNHYLDLNKPAVAVLYQPCRIPYRLSKFQHVNFHETDYDLAVAQLAATLNTRLAAATAS